MPTDEHHAIAIESIREDLRAHDARDQDDFRSLHGKIDGARDDISGLSVQVAWMRGELVSHGATLDRIEKSISRRARTEETLAVDTERYRKKRTLLVLKYALGVIAAGASIVLGAALHRWLG